MKFEAKFLDEVVQKITSAIPDDLKVAKENFEKTNSF